MRFLPELDPAARSGVSFYATLVVEIMDPAAAQGVIPGLSFIRARKIGSALIFAAANVEEREPP
jgi:hypothetical protein